jgi:pilus assembly protein Flp/PilA
MSFITVTILRLYSWAKEETGQTMAEYGLILALISIAAIIVMGTLGGQIGTVFTNVTSALSGA